MMITLELPPEIEAKLREGIARRDAESIRQLLTDALPLTVEALLRQAPQPLTEAEFETLADQLANELATYLGPNAPALSDYAVSRAGIYEDHP